jgi:quercetin dioxygenase-like cupin family protein
MKRLFVLGFLVIMSAFVAADGVPTVVTYVPNSKVTEVMTTGGPIVNDKGLVILANRRTSGEAEVHDRTNHIFIIVEGEATFVTGGKLVGAKNTAPGQIRATSIDGGQTHQLRKGDVITIPAKTPHWWKEVSTKTIGYYAINTEP